MANASSSSQVYNLYSGNLNGTFNNTSCPSAEIDYTVYFKLVTVLLLVISTTLVSGFAALARAIRSLRPVAQDCRCSDHRSHVQDVEKQRLSTDMFDEYDVEEAREVDLADLALSQPTNLSDHDARKQILHPSNPQRPPSPPPPQGRKSRKLWKMVQTAVSNGGWTTHAMNAAAVAVGCVLGGPPSLQYNLPAPATEPGRPH